MRRSRRAPICWGSSMGETEAGLDCGLTPGCLMATGAICAVLVGALWLDVAMVGPVLVVLAAALIFSPRRRERKGGDELTRAFDMDTRTEIQQPGGTMVPLERLTPARVPEPWADVLVPACQALLTGALVAALVIFLIGQLAPDTRGDLPAAWLGLALAITSVSWVLLLLDSRRLLWGLERITGMDLDDDDVIGELQTIEIHLQEGGQTRIIGAQWLGMSDERLLMLAADLVRGRSLAEGELGKDKALFPSGINEYRTVRKRLAEAGLVALVNRDAPSQGYRITAAGRAVFRRLAEENAHTRAHTHGQQEYDMALPRGGG